MEAVYRILVVDDDIELGDTIAEELEAAGGFVAEVVTTIQAAEEAVLAPTSDVSALLLDVGLPDGDGRELCARLRKNGVNLPVIMLSGMVQEDDVVQGLDSGADAAWFRKCHFKVTPEIDRALTVEGFLALGVTLI